MTDPIDSPLCINYTGAKSKLETRTRHDALVLFQDAKTRLLNINDWNILFNNVDAEFRLTSRSGELLQTGGPSVGNFIRIKIPDSPDKPDFFDWVRVEKFENDKDLLKDEESFGFSIRQVNQPEAADSKNTCAYTNYLTSTFLLIRKSSTVHMLEYQCKVVDGKTSLLNRLRNLFSSVSFTMGFVRSQWRGLVKGILRPGK